MCRWTWTNLTGAPFPVRGFCGTYNPKGQHSLTFKSLGLGVFLRNFFLVKLQPGENAKPNTTAILIKPCISDLQQCFQASNGVPRGLLGPVPPYPTRNKRMGQLTICWSEHPPSLDSIQLSTCPLKGNLSFPWYGINPSSWLGDMVTVYCGSKTR